MSKESLKVLEMVAEGKISPEDGERLIRALESKSPPRGRGFLVDMPEIRIPKIDMGHLGEVCVELKNTLVEGAKKASGQIKRGRAKRYFDFKDYPISVDVPEGINRCKLNLEMRAGRLKLKGGDANGKVLAGKVKRVPDPPILISDVRDGHAEITLKHSLGRCNLRLSDAFSYHINVDNAAADAGLDLSTLKVEDLELDNNAGNIVLLLSDLVERVKVNVKNNAGNVRIRVPEGHALKIASSGSLSSSNLEKYGLELVDGVAVSPDWNSNSRGVEIMLRQNVAHFQLDWKRRSGVSVGDEDEPEEVPMISDDLE